MTVPSDWEGLANFNKKHDDYVDGSLRPEADAFYGVRGLGLGFYLGKGGSEIYGYGLGKLVIDVKKDEGRIVYVSECTDNLDTLKNWLQNFDRFLN